MGSQKRRRQAPVSSKDKAPVATAESNAAVRVVAELLGEPEPATTPTPGDEGAGSKKKKRRVDVGSERALPSPVSLAKDSSSTPQTKPARSRPAQGGRPVHEPQHVEGVFQGDQLYLKDPATGHVFSSVRDQHDGLVLVGQWDNERNTVDFTLPEPAPQRVTTKQTASKRTLTTTAAAQSDPPKPTRVRPKMEEDYPFSADPDDHCETDSVAYADIKSFLLQLCALTGKTKETLRIYDPFYCAGSVVRHLGALGFTQVYNKKEDFYAKVEAGTVPEYDVLVTNPPYSQDHVERLLKFCGGRDEPWLLLLPNYVHAKPYYPTLLGTAAQPFYMLPKKRYCYWTPKGVARGNPNVRKDGRTSPCITFWYIDCKKLNAKMLRWWQQKGFHKNPHVKVYKDLKALPEFAMETQNSKPPQRRRSAGKS